jgi:hypothetical protein
MRLCCPACSRPVLSRRTKQCSFCQKPLPAELLFTPAEIEQVEAAERERKRLCELRQKVKVRLQEAAKRSSYGGDGGGFF